MRVIAAILLFSASAYAGVFRQGVNSVAVTGSAQLKQDVTFTAGSNVTLSQSGQTISIAAAGGSTSITAVTKTANYSISSSDSYLSYVGTTTATFTLPSCTSAYSLNIENYSFYALTITRSGSDVIIAPSGSANGDSTLQLNDYGAGADVACYGGGIFYVH